MGFYYDPGNQGEDEEQGSFRDAMAMTLVVFRLLALPLALLLGAIAGLVLLFVLFTTHVMFGFGALALIVLAVIARAYWEWRHPPTFE